ncbi:MAG: efflux RND transporter permease subunit, partial [Nitrospirae bacterium]|nr:efflux RND transporter permease subunit [Nitrospirota bacterium]
MINRIIEWSAQNRFLVVLFTLFAFGGGVWALYWTPKDAIPDLSDVQVIVYTEWMGRSPNLLEDQVTYPLVTTMLAAPRVKYVRGVSDFGQSYVYVIFEDGTDLYWARSRVLEYLSGLTGRFPPGATPRLGPDATALGWVYQYALVDESGKQDLASLRSFQDWYLRYWLQSVPGVSEVAAVGGFVKQYQVQVNPSALLAYNLPLGRIIEAVRRSNLDVGGRSIEMAQREYMIRGRGYIRSLADLEQIAVGTDGRGTPILVKDIARVQFGPDMRRGIAELNGRGETVGGVVIMRYGQDVLAVIDAVKEKLKEIAGSLPKGVSVVSVYDRSELIYRAINTLTEKLIEEIIIVSLVCLLFLYHLRSALVAILILPIAIAISFLPMYYLGLTSNIMSLGGIAIAIGAMVDAAIVMIENAHKRLEHAPPGSPRLPILVEAAKEVGRPLFFSLLIITVSFLPVFSLEAQEGRLFKPLAFTKTFAMFFASLLSITLAPVLMVWFIKGKIFPEHLNPVNRVLIRLYQPLVQWVLRRRWTTVLAAVVALGLTLPAFWALESEFMPPLNEGSFLYMPTSNPGLSVTEASRILQVQDLAIKQFPEVESVFGKIGRANTATDP